MTAKPISVRFVTVTMTTLTAKRTPLSTKMKYQYKARKVNGRRIDEHRLVAIAHWGEEACRGKVVHHKNGNKTDNRIENLELQDRSFHSRHHMKWRIVSNETKRRLSASVGQFYKTHTRSNAKPVIQFTKSGDIVAIYESATAASYYGFDRAHIKSCCQGKIKTEKGFVWKYMDNPENYGNFEIRTRVQAISMGV